MKKTRLYNVIFPMFMLVLNPLLILPVSAANFIIDSAVILICFRILASEDLKLLYKRTVIKVWLLGFAADFIGSGILFIASIIAGNIGKDLEYSINYNPYKNPYALMITVAVVLLCGALIYIFNRWISFRKVELSCRNKRIISLALALFTSPYLFLIPAYY